MCINFETCDGSNKNSLCSLTIEVKYHYPNEITVITRKYPSMVRSAASDTQHGAVTHVKLACQSELERLKGNPKRVVVEQRVLSRDTLGLASWS